MTDTTTVEPQLASIEKTIELSQDIERFWRAISDPAEIGQWFPTKTAELELRPGGVGVFAWNGHGKDGGDAVSEIHVERVEPPTYLAWSWGHEDQEHPATLVEFSLTANASGGTTLHLRESGFVVEAERADHVQGWDAELGELVEYLA